MKVSYVAQEDNYQLTHDYWAEFIHSSKQPSNGAVGRGASETADAERKQLQQARRAILGLGALALFSMGAVIVALTQQQKAANRESNAELLAQSLRIKAELEAA